MYKSRTYGAPDNRSIKLVRIVAITDCKVIEHSKVAFAACSGHWSLYVPWWWNYTRLELHVIQPEFKKTWPFFLSLNCPALGKSHWD